MFTTWTSNLIYICEKLGRALHGEYPYLSLSYAVSQIKITNGRWLQNNAYGTHVAMEDSNIANVQHHGELFTDEKNVKILRSLSATNGLDLMRNSATESN